MRTLSSSLVVVLLGLLAVGCGPTNVPPMEEAQGRSVPSDGAAAAPREAEPTPRAEAAVAPSPAAGRERPAASAADRQVSALARVGLAARLPRETLVYAEVDIGRALDLGRKYIEFIDAERAGRIAFNVVEVHSILKELASRQEFSPALLDDIAAAGAYFVVLREKDVLSEGEGPAADEPEPWRQKDEFSASLVLETTPEIAGDCLGEIKALLRRMKERHLEGARSWREYDVDRGELVVADDDIVVGRTGKYLVLSDCPPRKLWGALVDPARPSLAETELYGRYAQRRESAMFTALVNVGKLLSDLERSLVLNIEKAERRWKESGGQMETEPWGDDEGPVEPWYVRSARSELGAFRLFDNVFGIRKAGYAGISLGMSTGKQAAETHFAADMAFGGPVEGALFSVLDGGRRLEAPAVGEAGVAIMGRLDLKAIYAEVVKNLEPAAAMQFGLAMLAMKMQAGYDISDILGAMAGDIYLFVDITKKEIEHYEYDPETEDFKRGKVIAPAPEILVLCGLADGEAFSGMLSKMSGQLMQWKDGGGMFGKRTYNQSDVYVIGMGADDEASEPDGVQSFAAAVVGRCFVFGSWKGVTRCIRLARAGESGGDGLLGRLVARHREANLITVVPKAFEARLKEMMAEEGKDPLKTLVKQIEDEDFDIGDAELAGRLRTSLVALLRDAFALQEKLDGMRPEAAYCHGQLRGNVYEVRADAEIRK